jgi:hypothetical protein
MNFASRILFDTRCCVLELAAVDELTAEQDNGPDDN